MIRRQAVKNTDNPPGQIVNPIPDAITEKNIKQWREYEYSRNVSAQPVRMLTQEELEHCRLWHDGPLNQQLGVLRKFCEVNAGRTIPADGKIGGIPKEVMMSDLARDEYNRIGHTEYIKKYHDLTK